MGTTTSKQKFIPVPILSTRPVENIPIISLFLKDNLALTILALQDLIKKTGSAMSDEYLKDISACLECLQSIENRYEYIIWTSYERVSFIRDGKHILELSLKNGEETEGSAVLTYDIRGKIDFSVQ